MLAGRPSDAVETLQAEPREDWRLVGLAMALLDRDRLNPDLEEPSNASDLALTELLEKYRENMAYNIAYAYAYLGDADAAFEWLENAIVYEDSGLGEILGQPLFANIHKDPRWLPFLHKLGRAPEQLSPIQFSIEVPE